MKNETVATLLDKARETILDQAQARLDAYRAVEEAALALSAAEAAYTAARGAASDAIASSESAYTNQARAQYAYSVAGEAWRKAIATTGLIAT